MPSRNASTPTRRLPGRGEITGDIPAAMLETPPHAPFVDNGLPFGEGSAIMTQQPQLQPDPRDYHTPTTADHMGDSSQLQSTGLDHPMSDAEPGDEDSLLESPHHDVDNSRQLEGFRDISSLAAWTLSSSKPGCSLAQLRHPNPSQFWQSDGSQPHTLTLHFFKLVSIVKMRIYLDFDLDDSYTPTKMKFFAGMSEGGLVEFATWEVQYQVDPETGETVEGMKNVRGWIDISLQGVGGRELEPHSLDALSYPEDYADEIVALGFRERQLGGDVGPNCLGGDVLKCMVVQVRICENHQNGKDTHVRGFQVFARDDSASKGSRKVIKKHLRLAKQPQPTANPEGPSESREEIVGLEEAAWMAVPQIR